MYVSEKSCFCAWRLLSLLDNQLKQVNSSFLAVITHAKTLPSQHVCLDIIDYIHSYFFTLDFSPEKWLHLKGKFKKKRERERESAFRLNDSAVVNEEWYCLNLIQFIDVRGGKPLTQICMSRDFVSFPLPCLCCWLFYSLCVCSPSLHFYHIREMSSIKKAPAML